MKWSLHIALTGFLLIPISALAQENLASRWPEMAKESSSLTEAQAFQALAQLHSSDFSRPNEFDRSTGFHPCRTEEAEPLETLCRMGLDALPVLAEALDDTTLTQTVTVDRWGTKRVWRVNELAAELIRQIGGRFFEIGEEPKQQDIFTVGQSPELAPRFKSVVLDWYKKNKDLSVEARMLGDLQDGLLQNRLQAIRWLGEQKSAAAARPIAERINTILASGKEDSRLYTELSMCAEALGRIGNQDFVQAVRRVCKHHINMITYCMGPVEQCHFGESFSTEFESLFQAYQGLAALGAKDDALRQLKEVYERYGEKMDPSSREEYEARLGAAANW